MRERRCVICFAPPFPPLPLPRPSLPLSGTVWEIRVIQVAHFPPPMRSLQGGGDDLFNTFGPIFRPSFGLFFTASLLHELNQIFFHLADSVSLYN